MVSNMSYYLRRYVLEHTLMGSNHPSPSALYLALYLEDPQPDNSGDEVSGAGYARQPLGFTLTGTELDAAANTAVALFPNAGADWGRVTHWAVLSALSGGNLLYFGEVNTARSITTGNTFRAPAGNVVVHMREAT